MAENLPDGYGRNEIVAWLILHHGPNGTSKEVVLSPLTDDHYMDEGDEAWPLYLTPVDELEI